MRIGTKSELLLWRQKGERVSSILIKNGRLVDPANNIDGVKDILIEGNIIKEVNDSIEAQGDKVIDA